MREREGETMEQTAPMRLPKKKKRTNILKFVILNGWLAWDQQTLADGAPH